MKKLLAVLTLVLLGTHANAFELEVDYSEPMPSPGGRLHSASLDICELSHSYEPGSGSSKLTTWLKMVDTVNIGKCYALEFTGQTEYQNAKILCDSMNKKENVGYVFVKMNGCLNPQKIAGCELFSCNSIIVNRVR